MSIPGMLFFDDGVKKGEEKVTTMARAAAHSILVMYDNDIEEVTYT